MLTFTDSIEENVEVLRELLAGIPQGARNRAKRAAVAIENVVVGLQRDNPKDAAVALGTAFAIFLVAQRFLAAERGEEGKGVVQLLS